MAIDIDGKTYSFVLKDAELTEISTVAEPEFVSQSVTLDENVWNKSVLEIVYVLRVTDAEKWALDQLLIAAALVALDDNIYPINDNVLVKSIEATWDARTNNTRPWLLTITLLSPSPTYS